MTILQLLFSFIKVGLFSFGGGYAAMPLIQNQVIYNHNWLTTTEFADIITISQMTPGPIGINCATFTGVKIASIPGGIIATLGFILPSCFIVTILAILYKRYKNLIIIQEVLRILRPGVVALIASAGISILLISLFGTESFPADINSFSFLSAGLIVLSLLILRKFKLNPIYVIVGSGVIGGIIFYIVDYSGLYIS